MAEPKPTVLHFGVIDIPYQARRGSKAQRTTTGAVAEILEARYGVMQNFYEQHEQEIADQLTQALVDSAEAMMQGAPTTLDPFGAATAKIEDSFKTFLSMQEMDSLGVPGVPTKAAREGRSSRFKKGKGRGPRPSFVDTATYENSFKAWVTTDKGD